MPACSELSRIFKAIASNQLARFAPALYVKLTKQTGRGDAVSETPQDIADYFFRCLDDYAEKLNLSRDDLASFLLDKEILEYGPGDLPGVALLLVSMGAKRVSCVDRFPLVKLDSKSIEVIHRLEACLPDGQKPRFRECFTDFGKPTMRLNHNRVSYVISPDGLSGLVNSADVVISRAVLEHVNNIEATFDDMLKAMKPGALAIHQVDLKSHGLHRSNPLDFLAYPSWLWSLMYSHKGVPNRWRIGRYREILSGLPLNILELSPTATYSSELVGAIHGKLAKPFSESPPSDLAWQGFWLKCTKIVH